MSRVGIGFFIGLFLFGFWATPGRAAPEISIQAEWSTILLALENSVQGLKQKLAVAGIDYRTEDFDRLWKKIGPQAKLKDRPLIIMLAGLHNSGKSTLLNMVIGAEGDQRVTTVSAIGGSTTIPVALIPNGFPEKNLDLLFNGFALSQLLRATDATADAKGQTRLLWKKHKMVPPNIVVVDTPDLDSYHLENGYQTKAMVDTSDVVMVMLTDQYANRDLMKMMMEVSAAKKPVIFVFNKVNLQRHQALWNKRIAELQAHAKLDVIGAFAITEDYERAERGALLDFYRIGKDGKLAPQLVSPLEAIQELKAEELRIQSEWGAVQHALGAESGLESFIAQVEATNSALGEIQRLFSETEGSRPTSVEWPNLPVQSIGRAILDAWGSHHRGWTTTIIRSIPYWIKRSVGSLMKYRYHEAIEAEERSYRQSEFAFLRDHVVARVISELVALQKSGKISGRLAKVVSEKTDPLLVSQMQAKLQAVHEHTKLVDADLDRAINSELDNLKENHPGTYALFQNADTVLSGVELVAPMLVGLGTGSLITSPLLSNFATGLVAGPAQTAVGVFTWANASPMTALTGDKVRGFALRKSFENIVQQYANARIVWVMSWLKDNYLGDFYSELGKTAAATSASEIGELHKTMDCARRLGERISRR